MHHQMTSQLSFFWHQTHISDRGDAVMSSHTLREPSIHFGFGLNALLVWLFKAIGEFLT